MAMHMRPMTDQGQTKAVYLIMDGLPLHWTLETMLCNWGHPRFHLVPSPMCASWLNLIEGFWKLLGHLALVRRDCQTTDDLEAALCAGVDEWNSIQPFL